MSEKEFTWMTIALALTIFLVTILVHDEGIDCAGVGTETPPNTISCYVEIENDQGFKRRIHQLYELEKR